MSSIISSIFKYSIDFSLFDIEDSIFKIIVLSIAFKHLVDHLDHQFSM